MTAIEKIINLLNERDIPAYRLTSDLGLNNCAVTEWKKGKGKPSANTLAKIANYFNVTVDYLLDLEVPKSEIQAAFDKLTPEHKDEILKECNRLYVTQEDRKEKQEDRKEKFIKSERKNA